MKNDWLMTSETGLMAIQILFHPDQRLLLALVRVQNKQLTRPIEKRKAVTVQHQPKIKPNKATTA